MKQEAPRRVRFRLLKIVTSDEETYFVRSADLEGARVVESRFIPICDARGEDLPREPRGRVAVIPIEKLKGSKMSWVKVNIVRGAFTLVEVMVVVALIAVIGAFAVPGFMLAHKKNLGHACRDNLIQIEQAKRDYMSDNDGALPPSDINAANGLRRYFLNGVVPTCPAGGAYSDTTTVGKKCSCSLNYPGLRNAAAPSPVEGPVEGPVAIELPILINPKDETEKGGWKKRYPYEIDTGGDLSVNGYHDPGY